MLEIDVHRTMEETAHGLPLETYIPRELSTPSDPFLILAGMNVLPPLQKESTRSSYEDFHRDNYHGAFPAFLAQSTSQIVHVVYQPAVAPHGHTPYFYSADTSQKQLEDALASAGRPSHVITHSLSTLVGYDLLTGKRGALKHQDQVLSVTLTAPFTTMKDALTEQGKERRILGIKWMTLFQLAQHLPLYGPYPLTKQYWHDGNTKEPYNPRWQAIPIVHTKSARYTLNHNGFQEVSHADTSLPCLVVIPSQDKVFSPDEQRDIARELHAQTVEIPAGHRWFTAPQQELMHIIDALKQHTRKQHPRKRVQSGRR